MKTITTNQNRQIVTISIFIIVFILIFFMDNDLYAQAKQATDPFGNNTSGGAGTADNFFKSEFGQRLVTVIKAVLIILGFLYSASILLRLIKDMASTNEQGHGSEDEIAEKKKLLTTALFKIGVILAIAIGGTGLLSVFAK